MSSDCTLCGEPDHMPACLFCGFPADTQGATVSCNDGTIVGCCCGCAQTVLPQLQARAVPLCLDANEIRDVAASMRVTFDRELLRRVLNRLDADRAERSTKPAGVA